MSKEVLADALQTSLGIPAVHARTGVDAVMDTILDSLKKTDRFTMPGFGTFTVAKRPAHKARNPRTGEVVKIAANRTVRFKASPVLRNFVTSKRAKA
jgi:DNA-binding protein HU-beta